MKVFLIGLGGAGCKVVHTFLSKDNIEGVLIDTDIAALSYLKHRYRIPAGDGILGGEGVKKDLSLGMEVIQADRYSLTEKITRIKDDVDCFFVVSALGGGTGGAAGVLLEELKKNFIEPIYYIGLLPSQEDFPTVTINAAKALKETIRHCDAFFPIDMDQMKTSTRLKGNYASLNNQIFRYFRRVFQIGEFRGKGDIGENMVDVSDFIKTLKGLSVVGLRGKNLNEDPNADKPEAIISLTRSASKSTTLLVSPQDTNKALIVVLGDKNYIDFLGSIPARLWIEKQISGSEVRGGDMPLSQKGVVEVLVIFSDIKRSDEMANLYKKVEVLGKGQLMDENLTEAIEKLGSMKVKLSDLESDLDETYQSLKGGFKK